MKFKPEDLKDIKIRRKPTFNDILRIVLGIGIIVFGFVCATGVVPDTKKSAPVGLVIFGILFICWGFYPMCSKKEPSSSRVLDAIDRMRVMPESPGQLRKVRIPGTDIRAGYTKEEMAKMNGEAIDENAEE